MTKSTELGANRIQSVDFHSSKIKNARRKARRMAVDAAREKAENYCEAAGVELGKVLSIEDIDPTRGGGENYRGEAWMGGDADSTGALDAGDIEIAGAVEVLFDIK